MKDIDMLLNVVIFFLFSLLFGCSDFLSTFYHLKPQSGDIDMLMPQADMIVLVNSNDIDLDGFTTEQGDCDDADRNIYPNAPEIFDDQIDQNCDSFVDIEGRSCLSRIHLKIGEQFVEFDGCNDWSSDLNIIYDSTNSPQINQASIKFSKLELDSPSSCYVEFQFTAISCGIEQVYQITNHLKVDGCIEFDGQYLDTYSSTIDQGLIVSFSGIDIHPFTSNHSINIDPQKKAMFTRLSGFIGTHSRNGMIMHSTSDSTEMISNVFLYASFDVTSIQTWPLADLPLSCSQKPELLRYDSDGDGEAIDLYGFGNKDCDDRNQGINSTHSAQCPPCWPHCPDIEMILIEAGEFYMGSDVGLLNEQPRHLVQIRNQFYVGKTEVTVAQYRACVNYGPCSRPNDCDDNDFPIWTDEVALKEDHPVNCVSWNQARIFAKWIGGDLLTEAQWEYVATAQGQSIIYPWGNEVPTCQLANYSQCVGSTSPVCSVIGGNTTQGVCDMSGNVWEWVLDDRNDDYIGAPNNELAWCHDIGICNTNTSTNRVYRGGSWFNDISTLRASHRNWTIPDRRRNFLGFRTARPIP